MEKGDLSNDMPARVLVVANDFLIKPQANRSTWKFEITGRGFGRRRRLIDQLEIDPEVRAWLHDYTWRRHFRVDVVVIGWVDDSWLKALHDRFDRMNLSIAQVYGVRDAKELVDSLAYMPEVTAVVHGRPDWNFAFGPRGICGASNLGTL